jgi:hypothetical protein
MPVDWFTSGAGPPWLWFPRKRHGPRHHGHDQPGSSSAAEPGRELLADLGLSTLSLPLELRLAGDLSAAGGSGDRYPRWRMAAPANFVNR